MLLFNSVLNNVDSQQHVPSNPSLKIHYFVRLLVWHAHCLLSPALRPAGSQFESLGRLAHTFAGLWAATGHYGDRIILMKLKELMTLTNYIARTEGSTQPDGSFGPSAWESHDRWQRSAASMVIENHNKGKRNAEDLHS